MASHLDIQQRKYIQYTSSKRPKIDPDITASDGTSRININTTTSNGNGYSSACVMIPSGVRPEVLDSHIQATSPPQSRCCFGSHQTMGIALTVTCSISLACYFPKLQLNSVLCNVPLTLRRQSRYLLPLPGRRARRAALHWGSSFRHLVLVIGRLS